MVTDDDCCNSCEEVREAYRKKGWAISNPDLIDQGLAKYVEWSANMMEEDARRRLKLAELQAKKERIRIWTNYVPPPSNSKAIHNQNFTGKVELLAYNDMNVPFQYFDLAEICDAGCIYLMAEIFAFNIGFPLDLTQFICSRRVVLDERLKCSEQSTAALVGSLLHQIFQAGLLLEVPTEDLLYEYSRIVLNKNVENLYACGVNENEVYVTLAGAIPRIINWIKLFKHSQNSNIFGNPTSSFGGQAPMQTVWETKVNKSIPPTNDFKAHQAVLGGPNADSSAEKAKRVTFDPFDMPSNVRTLARILYSAHGGEVAVTFLRGGVHIFSGPSFAPVDNYQITVGSAIAAPTFSSTSCCSASVWHDSSNDCTILKIIHVFPPALASNQAKANSSTWERAIAERFWWSLLVGVDWWDAVGCTQSAAEDGIGEDMQVSFSAEGIG
ncbi:hypothetical protein Ancab_011061, partial [Ancistrocladus abbreviatus]